MAVRTVTFSRPTITRKDMMGVLECMVEDAIGEGELVRKFEKKFAETVSARDALMLHSASAALFLIFQNLNIQPGDEIVISAYVESCFLEVIKHFGAVAVAVDIDEGVFTANAASLKNAVTEKTKAVIVSHIFGYPVKFVYEDLNAAGKVSVIEDCTHALGSASAGVPVGTLGDYAVFSFSSESMITSGQGAAVTCKNRNDWIALRDLRSWRDKEDIKGRLDMSVTDLQAAMVLSELSLLNKFIERRREIGKFFKECAFKGRNRFAEAADGCELNFHSFPLMMSSALVTAKEMFKRYGIQTQEPVAATVPMLLGVSEDAFPNAREARLKTLCLPIYPALKKSEIEEIGKLITHVK